jgi:hypothetical protein
VKQRADSTGEALHNIAKPRTHLSLRAGADRFIGAGDETGVHPSSHVDPRDEAEDRRAPVWFSEEDGPGTEA